MLPLPGFRRHALIALCAVALVAAWVPNAGAQSFGVSNLDFSGNGGVAQGTSLQFGPDGRLYVLQLDGTIDVLTIDRAGPDDYVVVASEEILAVRSIPNHDDDGSASADDQREATGLTVVGTAANPVIYATSSDSRVGGPSGDKNLDTNSGVITRLAWQGSHWEVVDIVRGLPRSEENHAINGLEFVTIGGVDYLIVCAGGHTNAGSPSNNFAWLNEYALSAALLAVDLTALEALPISNDGQRDYVYDLPTLDDPTRSNANGFDDPNDESYDGVDLNDPWGGNDGLNQAKLVPGGPVQIFSPGYRNSYDLVITESGAVYLTDNGANGGWGGFPELEGINGDTTNNYRPGEPGSTAADPLDGEPQVNNSDHLSLVTTDIDSYLFGSFYGGHPAPIRANPMSAGLFTRGAHSSDPGDANGNTYTDDWFRNVNFDPNGSGEASDPDKALPADWPPVPVAMSDPSQGDFRNPGGSNPDGPVDAIVTTWQNNTNGIDEYTASNFGGALQGDLIAGKSGGTLHRVQLNPDGSLANLELNWLSNLGGNPLGVTANGDADPFPGTIWVGTFSSNIVVLEPQDFVTCILPGEPGYDANADNDFDGYSNQDEIDNDTDFCNGGSQPGDVDKVAGGTLVSDLNDEDDDADGIPDASDPMQFGNPAVAGTDAFALPVDNELFSDNPLLGGYLGLGFTGMMNNGAPNPNWLDWLDQLDAGPNPNDVLGGAVGAMTMQMTEGSAYGTFNDQEKGFQYGVDVELATGGFTVQGRLLNFNDGLQLYPTGGDAELGIFLGDGTQSNYIELLAFAGGIEAFQEIGDVPQALLADAVAVGERPGTSIEFELRVDSGVGTVEALYGFDGGPLESLGTINAEGSVLQAIRQAGVPVMVGLIGSSNAQGLEVEGTWDYLRVFGRQPSIVAAIPDVSETPGAGPFDVDLDAHFGDDEGVGNLTYSVEAVSDPAFAASIAGSVLTVSFPGFAASAAITVRATDSGGLFQEQTFSVATSDPVAIYRVNAGGAQTSAIDGGIPWEQDTTSSNSVYLVDPGTNRQAEFDLSSFTPAVDQTTTPVSIFQSERWSDTSGSPTMRYAFPISMSGEYEVRLYLGNGWSGSNDPGERIYSATLEGVAFGDLTDIDLSASYGHQVGTVVTHTVNVSDGLLEIDFLHGSIQHPLVNGIEIIGGAGTPVSTPISVTPIEDQANLEGDLVNLPVIANGGDTPGTFGFSAVGLPAGLQIEPTTGLVFGTITAGASVDSPYAVTVTVDDADADGADTVDVALTWTVVDPASPLWIDLPEDESYTGRHECSFVQVGDKFVLFGGRENAQTLDVYDYATDSWAQSAPDAPLPFNHFQAVEYQGLLWVIGAFKTNNFPNEEPAEAVWAFDPAHNVWIQGPPIPVGRRRGGAGLAVYNDKFYLVGGNDLGHSGGYQSWFDEFDPQTGVWTQLSDAPRARDHFHAAVVGDQLVLAGGRLTGGAGGTFAPLIAEVDAYDFTSGTWSTLASPSGDLPTPRAGTSTAVFDGEILVIGGEGNGIAYDTVEALDPATNQWRSLHPMNHPRHGSQAIVSGNGVYMAAGSPNQGGGNQKNMEVYNADEPAGAPSVAGVLGLPTEATVQLDNPEPVLLEHLSGNEGILVESVSLSGADAADFVLTAPVTNPFLLPTAGAKLLSVEYKGTESEAEAALDVVYSGGQTAGVVIGYRDFVSACDDGIDNDGDGFIDFAGGDPGCASAAWVIEDPQCQDGLDNDGQFGTDFDGGASAGIPEDPNGRDPHCSNPWDNREATSRCGLGIEAAMLLPLLGAWRRRRLRSATPRDVVRETLVQGDLVDSEFRE